MRLYNILLQPSHSQLTQRGELLPFLFDCKWKLKCVGFCQSALCFLQSTALSTVTFSSESRLLCALTFFSPRALTSSLLMTGSLSCSSHDHMRLDKTTGSLSLLSLSQAPSRQFSSVCKTQGGKKIQSGASVKGVLGRETGKVSRNHLDFIFSVVCGWSRIYKCSLNVQTFASSCAVVFAVSAVPSSTTWGPPSSINILIIYVKQ